VYKVTLSKEELKRLRQGDKELLLLKLRESDKKLIAELKTPNANVSFLQGSSHVIDRLIKALEINP